jgi:hypothetical protein
MPEGDADASSVGDGPTRLAVGVVDGVAEALVEGGGDVDGAAELLAEGAGLVVVDAVGLAEGEGVAIPIPVPPPSGRTKRRASKRTARAAATRRARRGCLGFGAPKLASRDPSPFSEEPAPSPAGGAPFPVERANLHLRVTRCGT